MGYVGVGVGCCSGAAQCSRDLVPIGRPRVHAAECCGCLLLALAVYTPVWCAVQVGEHGFPQLGPLGTSGLGVMVRMVVT